MNSSDVYKDDQRVTRKLCCLDFGCNTLRQSIMKYKLFSKCSIKQVRSPHWHWPSGLDMLGSFLARWIRGCLYFTRGVCCFFPLLDALSPCHCDANFPSEFKGFLPINTCHSFLIFPEEWRTGKKMEGNLGVVAKEQCTRIITKKDPAVNFNPFSPGGISRGLTWQVKRTHKYELYNILYWGEKNQSPVQTMNNICLVQMCIVEINLKLLTAVYKVLKDNA